MNDFVQWLTDKALFTPRAIARWSHYAPDASRAGFGACAKPHLDVVERSYAVAIISKPWYNFFKSFSAWWHLYIEKY